MTSALRLLRTPDGKWKGVAGAEWSAGAPGVATADITKQLQVGGNCLVLGLHNKHFPFGPGKWGYRFTLVADNSVAWTRAQAMAAEEWASNIGSPSSS